VAIWAERFSALARDADTAYTNAKNVGPSSRKNANVLLQERRVATRAKHQADGSEERDDFQRWPANTLPVLDVRRSWPRKAA